MLKLTRLSCFTVNANFQCCICPIKRIKLIRASSFLQMFLVMKNKYSVIIYKKKGKVNADIQIMTKEEADKLPAGFGRDGPQPLTVPK